MAKAKTSRKNVRGDVPGGPAALFILLLSARAVLVDAGTKTLPLWVLWRHDYAAEPRVELCAAETKTGDLSLASAECRSVLPRPLVERNRLATKDAFDPVRHRHKAPFADSPENRQPGFHRVP